MLLFQDEIKNNLTDKKEEWNYINKSKTYYEKNILNLKEDINDIKNKKTKHYY